NAGRAIIMSAEDNSCASTRRHVVGVRHEIRQYQDCAVHACAVDFPVFIDRETVPRSVRQIDYEVMPSFSPESSSSNANHEVVLAGLCAFAQDGIVFLGRAAIKGIAFCT